MKRPMLRVQQSAPALDITLVCQKSTVPVRVSGRKSADFPRRNEPGKFHPWRRTADTRKPEPK